MTTTVLVIFYYYHWYLKGGGGVGGGRVLKQVLYGEALPRRPIPYPFIIIIPFLAKMVLLSYTFF